MPNVLETARAHLLAHDFAAYTQLIEQAQNADQRQGDGLTDALDDALAACESQTRTIDQATAAWLAQAPESSAALMARATFLQARGSQARGSATADQVSAQGWHDMAGSYREAAQLWAKAAQRMKRPAYALAKMGLIAWVGGDELLQDAPLPGGQDWYAWGLAREPNSCALRTARLNTLRPEWGGSMQAFCAYRDDPAHPRALSAGGLRLFKRYAHSVLGHYLVYFTDEDARGMAEHDAAIALAPDSAWAYYFRGLSHLMLKEHDKALADLARAAELNTESTAILDQLVQTRWQISAQDAQLEPLLKRLVHKGFAPAWHDLARHRYWNLGDHAGAVAVWRQGAQEGLAQCAWELGRCYEYGAHGVLAVDYDEAARCYQQAFDSGLSGPASSLWNLVDDGKTHLLTPEAATTMLLQAALWQDDAEAHRYAAWAIRNRGLRYDTDAHNQVQHLRFVTDALQADSEDARRYIAHLKQASQGDNAWAQLDLANEYFSGQYIDKNVAQGHALLTHVIDSATPGTSRARAQTLLAQRLLDGTDGEGNESGDGERALQLLQDAAKQGQHDALTHLIDLYALGHKRLGLKPNPKQAEHWAAQAVQAGTLNAADADQRAHPHDHEESLGRSILYHLIFGPIALVWTLLVAIFGKRFLKRVIYALLAVAGLLIVLVLATALLGSGKNQTPSQAADSAPPTSPASDAATRP